MGSKSERKLTPRYSFTEMQVGKTTRYISAVLGGPALDLKSHFRKRFDIGAIHDSGDRYVSVAIGTGEDGSMHIANGHEQLCVVA